MSEVNKMLNSLSQSQAPQETPELKPVRVKPLPETLWPRWLLAGLLITVAAGATGWWFGHSRAESRSAAEITRVKAEQLSSTAALKPEPDPVGDFLHAKARPAAETAPVTQQPDSQSVKASQTKAAVLPVVKKAPVAPIASQPDATPVVKPAAVPAVSRAAAPVRAAQTAPAAKAVTDDTESQTTGTATAMAELVEEGESGLSIESIALSPEQLARTDYDKAMKALAEGDTLKATNYLKSALEYQPAWIDARQRLSALYYGRGDVRRAMLTLQRGLAKQPDQQDLRLTMAKLLTQESQPEVALDVLSELPPQPGSEFLALRGALAQQLNNQPLALSSYQQLVDAEPFDGRWWLGLGIALERSQDKAKAVAAYTQALKLGQVSGQSQQFIRQRLAALKTQEG
ncbi:tetratricopeptide repeat protein [Photobacterium halotolerans]|uniref:Tetratricopeptide repeat protein n=1 Tax=Photobacterium halotolerans TaxID=265726 RepID=A0A7X5ATP8_9GAMM|nr:tetratricopeptide repeat protein [Photobacterium halotolerans]NAW65120.1 tetratricopeptide repeat protein [Photobacterium halotolerans]